MNSSGRVKRNLRAGLIAGMVIVGGCSKGGNGTATTTQPTQPPPLSDAQMSVNISFSRHALIGMSGAPSVQFASPPNAIGTANTGSGLSVLDMSYFGLEPVYASSRVAYDYITADFNGSGLPQVISSIYSPTTMSTSVANLYVASATGVYSQDPTFGANYVSPAGWTGYRGRTESLVVADFTNSGAVDVFMPTYTFLDSQYDLSAESAFISGDLPPNVNNAYQSYLLLNDGTGHFTEHAVEAGVSMHSTLSGLQPASTDPNGNQPEGAQAVDFNMDGLIDLYVGGHLFMNQGVDANGVPHFKDMAAAYGLTNTLLRAAPPWAPSDVLPPNYLVNDEGAKFIDWNNNGYLSLLIFRWNWGPAHGARLFEFNGSQFTERVSALTQTTPTCQHPVTQQTDFFYSSRPYTTGSMDAGINAYDLNNDGLEDVLVTGDGTGSAVFSNTGCGFTEVSAGDLAQVPGGGAGGMALADIDGDGKIDVIYAEATTRAYYINTSPTPTPSSFTVEVLGAHGEHNQYGRVIQVFPPGTSRIFTRAVDSGSGYLNQNQYPILVGTPFKGEHVVKVYYAPVTQCVYGGSPCRPAVVTFSISPGQRAEVYAPSSAQPGGSVALIDTSGSSGGPAAAAP
jgi:hypothetical protein